MAGSLPSTAPLARPAVAILARSPRVPGKTRLTAHLPADRAEALRRALLLDTIDAALAPGWPVHVFLAPPGEQAALWALLTADAALDGHVHRCHVHAQGHGDLGDRMADAMARTLAAGHDGVVLVGSDLPALPATALQDAVAVLSQPHAASRLVFGPSADGGFYLVAARAAWPAAFAGVVWSRDTVLAHTEARAREAGLDVFRVEGCADVDTMDDLASVLRAAPAQCAWRTRAWTAATP